MVGNMEQMAPIMLAPVSLAGEPPLKLKLAAHKSVTVVVKKRGRPRKKVLPNSPPMVEHIPPMEVDAAETTSGSELVVAENIDPDEYACASASARVVETLRTFNKYYLQLVQEEEKRVRENAANLSKIVSAKLKRKKERSKDNTENNNQLIQVQESGVNRTMKRAAKRPDLKAISKMKTNGEILYPDKRIGTLPGIEVGHQFYSRAEMVVLGFHSHWLNGIDFMGALYAKVPEYMKYSFPLAVCIVLSGMYEDDVDNADDVIYTGQGGQDLLSSRRQISNQKMERGNLALKNCIDSNVPVRVVRGHESANSYCGKVYTYDGLYKVLEYWAETGLSGFTVYKYRLRRLPGQPVLTTSQVQFSRAQPPKQISELRGLVCKDICGGKEDFPIPATNEVDEPPAPPADFEYIAKVRVPDYIPVPSSAAGCNCKGDCTDPRTCACARLNGSEFPYVRKDGGRLVEAKAVVFECGPNCGCDLACVNRTSQKGLRYRLEVFKTAKKGWAVRSWDFIPSGAPICEYTGVLSRTDEIESSNENNYIFDIDCVQTMKGLDGRERRVGEVALQTIIDDKEAPEFCIDAGHAGNVARFINHSCQPNLFVQCVLSSHHDLKMARVMLFAADNIPPLQELTYDYGYALDSVVGPDGAIKKLLCFCGAAGCRKRLY